MADILKITTPLVNKNQVQPQKQLDPSTSFQLSDITKVPQATLQDEILKQNNTLGQQESPNILANLLKDPAVTIGFLKNIFMMQEIIKLLPVNNQSITKEIVQLFEALLIGSDDIADEMKRQESNSTLFKGDLFNLLREISARYPQAQVRYSIATLLKAVNSLMRNRDILDSVANNLQFLSEKLYPNKELSSNLYELSQRFRGENAPNEFNELKKEVISLLSFVENSILYSSKLEKVSSITVYNLSRFNNNPDFLEDALNALLTEVDSQEDKQRILIEIRRFLVDLSAGVTTKESSKIMDVLAKIIELQAQSKDISLTTSDRVENIIHSMLSSPCNFTPLLHFVIPVEYQDIKSFAEIWVNPNEEDDQKEEKSNSRMIHMLLAFEIEGIGQFEVELNVRDSVIKMSMFCPSEYVKAFSGIGSSIEKTLTGSSYQFENILVAKLERSRSLMEVFKTLPHRRTGVDVKI
ncbi:MAG: antitoxin [Oscillospiraceae bacterium]